MDRLEVGLRLSLSLMSVVSTLTLCTRLEAAPRVLPPWSKARAPSEGTSEAIGAYADGCISGAHALPERGVGYRSIRRHRERYYGHPVLIDFLQSLAKKSAEAGLHPLAIGDLAQPRGGLMRSGHRSHQSGLDADIWFGGDQRYRQRVAPARRRALLKAQAEPALSRSQRDLLRHPSVLYRGRERIDHKVWSDRHRQLLRWAASDERVARIFVHWVIKAKLCEERASADGDESEKVTAWGWLQKIRPWYGHDRHFHVRLSCPAESPLCKNQAPLPEGNSCGAESWFSIKEVRARKVAAEKMTARGNAARGKLSPEERRRKAAERAQETAAKEAARQAERAPYLKRCGEVATLDRMKASRAPTQLPPQRQARDSERPPQNAQ